MSMLDPAIAFASLILGFRLLSCPMVTSEDLQRLKNEVVTEMKAAHAEEMQELKSMIAALINDQQSEQP
jgi:hypothetical protein|eukprot:COSAG06_NODE_4214_length_4468_cov_10.307780_3_plen_69_part_00